MRKILAIAVVLTFAHTMALAAMVRQVLLAPGVV
jgi:hypothetical protein